MGRIYIRKRPWTRPVKERGEEKRPSKSDLYWAARIEKLDRQAAARTFTHKVILRKPSVCDSPR